MKLLVYGDENKLEYDKNVLLLPIKYIYTSEYKDNDYPELNNIIYGFIFSKFEPNETIDSYIEKPDLTDYTLIEY